MKRFITSLIITAMITLSFSLGLPPSNTYAQTATYSCGTYGAGNYSNNGDACNPDSVAAPNTGFAAKLTEPAVAIPLGLSLLALIAGIALLVSKRRKKRMSFNN